MTVKNDLEKNKDNILLTIIVLFAVSVVCAIVIWILFSIFNPIFIAGNISGPSFTALIIVLFSIIAIICFVGALVTLMIWIIADKLPDGTFPDNSQITNNPRNGLV